mmetsp:Transcript_52288/g.122428  ORF Transcript_52288/g.122428 Transcript_52288/m.122428 type:complete len:327 (+) Transcript_52288:83-1063(+)
MKLLGTVFTALAASFGTYTYTKNQELESVAAVPAKCPPSEQLAYTGSVASQAADADASEGTKSKQLLEMEQMIAGLQAQLERTQAIPTCEEKIEEEIRDLGMDFYIWMSRCGTLFVDMSSHLGRHLVATVWPWPVSGFWSHSDVSTAASKAVDAVSNITCERTLSSLFNDGLGMKLETKAACEAVGEHVEKAVSAIPVDKLKSHVDYASDQAGRALSTPVEMARPILAEYVEDFVTKHPEHASTLQKDPVLISVLFVACALLALWLLLKELKVVFWFAKVLLRLTMKVLFCPCRLCCRRRSGVDASTGPKAASTGKRSRRSAVGGS